MNLPGRRFGRQAMLLGGMVGIVAGPLARRMGERMRERARTAGFGPDPVGPFREAPCYRRHASSSTDDRETTTAS